MKEVSPVEIKRILVVLDDDYLKADSTSDPTLLKRAVDYLLATKAEAMLFHGCNMATMEQRLFSDDEEVLEQKRKLIDAYATQLAEIALDLKSRGITVSHEARWDKSYADAVLRMVDEYQPDLVMLASHERSFYLGLLTNEDWELIRRSPVDLWFVKQGKDEINRLLTAIGTVAQNDDVLSDLDDDIYSLARHLSVSFNAQNIVLHSYQVPDGISAYAGYAPMMGVVIPEDDRLVRNDSLRQAIAAKHGAAINAFAAKFGIDASEIIISKGVARTTIINQAKNRNADLLVMGARNISGWQRIVEDVTAEPVLADIKCDVVFVKDPQNLDNDGAGTESISSRGAIDVEKAIIEPEKTFSSPAAVAAETCLSKAMRLRVLDAWEHDINARMIGEDEGAPLADNSDADRLNDIRKAKDALTTAG